MASAAVAPLRLARGLQNKVLEAMAMARPVVASPAAIEGLNLTPGELVLTADDPDAWVAAVSLLLTLTFSSVLMIGVMVVLSLVTLTPRH